MVNTFRWLTPSLLALSIGCTVPQNKFGSAEVFRDNRGFNNVNVYGKCDSDLGNLFGQFEMKSSTKHSDLANFNSRIRLVKLLNNYSGFTSEYRDFSGDANGAGGIGFSYSPAQSIELRIYPIRTDQTQEAGISFGKVLEMGNLDPYIRGFVDADKKGSAFYSVGKFQIGLKTKAGWRIGLEARYSDFDRRNDIDSFGISGGLGLDF